MPITQLDDERHVAKTYDKMASEYDTMLDPWFQHLYAELNRIIVNRIIKSLRRKEKVLVLDVGSGTGAQTILYAKGGFESVGVDISVELTKVAIQKGKNERLSVLNFSLSDAKTLPFGDETFDLVNCCGSTLSYIRNFEKAISEMSRVLKSDGIVIVEVENKWNFDLFWELFNALIGNPLGYRDSLRDVVGFLKAGFKRGCVITWPFTFINGSVEYMKLYIFTFHELKRLLSENKIKIKEVWGIHILTNLIPSTMLSNPRAPKGIRYLSRFLGRIDKIIGSIFPFNRFGCSIVIIGKKGEIRP